MVLSRCLFTGCTIALTAQYSAAQIDAAGQPHVAESAPVATQPRTSSIPLTARVTIGHREWTFSPAVAGGVRVDFRIDGVDRQYVLDCGGSCRQIEGIAACGYDVGSQAMIGLGVASRSADGRSLEYRMLFNRNANEHSAATWIHSEPLITTDAQNPFDLMGVSLTHGDSLMLTLQRLTRAGDGSAIDTHTFVNHCPVAVNGVMLDNGVITRAVSTARLSPDGDKSRPPGMDEFLRDLDELLQLHRSRPNVLDIWPRPMPAKYWFPTRPLPPRLGPNGRWIIDYRWFDKPGKWWPADR